MPKWFKYLTPSYMREVRREKQIYKDRMARIKALPADYRKVFKEIQSYMWSIAAGDGMDTLTAQYELIDFLEDGAANGLSAHELLGSDVAEFVDNMLKERNVTTWTEKRRTQLNKAVR